MNPHALIPASRPVRSRDRIQRQEEEPVDEQFLLAVSRAFLNAVGAHDRKGTVLYSRAMLNVMNHGRDVERGPQVYLP